MASHIVNVGREENGSQYVKQSERPPFRDFRDEKAADLSIAHRSWSFMAGVTFIALGAV
jgi:hypothetical protein